METVKGFSDVSREDALKREKVQKIIVRSFKAYGFEPAETPVVEYEDFVKSGNEQDEAVSDIFKLQDKGKRKLALRYEFTFQLKRLAKNKKLPYKRYQIGPVFRDEPTSSNRFRQFTQCDVDIVGSEVRDEAEILSITSNILKELGIKARININNRRLLNEILDREGIKNKEKVIKEIDKLDKLPESEVKANLKKLKADKVLEIFKKSESFFERYASYQEVKELKKYCKYYNLNVNFVPTLARGLSYYNGSIFEIKGELKETIAGGGSYLINGIQSTGISFGLDRFTSLTNIDFKEKKILLISIMQDEKTIQLTEKLRQNKINCMIMYGKPTKALEYANSYSIPYVIFIGNEEIKAKKFKLRDMKSGKEVMLGEKELIEKLNKY